MKGYIYVLTNKAFPRLVKIGMTYKDPRERAAELSTTGVPFPFKVHGYIETDEYERLEKLVHKNLDGLRANKGREFFQIHPDKAMSIIERWTGKADELKLLEEEKAERERIKKEEGKRLNERKARVAERRRERDEIAKRLRHSSVDYRNADSEWRSSDTKSSLWYVVTIGLLIVLATEGVAAPAVLILVGIFYVADHFIRKSSDSTFRNLRTAEREADEMANKKMMDKYGSNWDKI